MQGGVALPLTGYHWGAVESSELVLEVETCRSKVILVPLLAFVWAAVLRVVSASVFV